MSLSFDPTYFIGSDLKLLHYRPGEMEVEWRFLHWLLWYYEMTNAFGYTHTNILTDVQRIWFIMKKVVDVQRDPFSMKSQSSLPVQELKLPW